jgi:two-component system, cell cycle sensor histidine kinase and response regulator CckA
MADSDRLKGIEFVVSQSDERQTYRARILVMDDEECIRETFGEMLKRMGYDVEYASNGVELLQKITSCSSKRNSFQGIIMDLSIPGGMGGKETINELRKIDPSIKAFVSSGYSEDPIMDDPQFFGFTDKIPKPFRRIELEEILNKYF